MSFTARRLLAGVLATTALASAAVTLDSGAAGAATARCTAWGTLPAHVSLGAKAVTVTMVLTGSSGCQGQGFDNGATATLRGPAGQPADPQRWKKFGAGERQTFAITLDKTGTYTLRNGNVQLYDGNSVRVPWTWRRTSTVVKHAAAFRHVTRSHSTITADLRTYTTQGWKAQSNDAVVLQRRSGSTWKSVVQERSSRSGAVAFSLSTGGSYRLVSTANKYAASATSPTV
jgi:hypothetical protein